jgi:hypothetical protein
VPSNSGSLAKFAAIRWASSLVSNLATDRRPVKEFLASNFVRIHIDDDGHWVADSLASLVVGANPCFDAATSDERHVKLGAGNGRRTVV